MLYAFVLVFTVKALAELNVSVDLKEVSRQSRVHLKHEVLAQLNKTFTLKDPRMAREIEVRISEKMPQGIGIKRPMSGLLFYDMKVFSTAGGNRKLVATPQVLIRHGQTATLETKDDDTEMTLKIASH